MHRGHVQMCLVGETRLWLISDIKLREDNDELSKRLAHIEHAGAPDGKLAEGDDKLFNQVPCCLVARSVWVLLPCLWIAH